MNKVVIIGNGKSVLQKKNGKEIDEYPQVVRINRFRLNGYEPFVGTKTDVIAFSKAAFTEYIKPNNILYKEFIAEQKQNLLNLHTFYKQNNLNKREIRQKLTEVKHNALFYPEVDLASVENLLFFPIQQIPSHIKCHKFVENTFNYSTGTSTIIYYVNNGYDVTITGFDFFANSSCYWLKSSEIFTEKKLINDRTSGDGHPYLLEKILISKFIALNKVKILK